MDEFTLPKINAHMSHLIRWMEKDKVSRTQLMDGHRIAGSDLPGSGAWKLYVEKIIEDALYEA